MTSYTAHAIAIAGRNGHAETSDGAIKVDLSMPKELGGEAKPGATNPEQLFALGYAACFGSALTAVAREKKQAVGEISVEAAVTISKGNDGFKLAVVLEASIGNTSKTDIEALMQGAHQMCPYSKATRGNIEVMLRAKG